MTSDAVLGWIAIGVAASLAVMIWPFRRGTTGIVTNLVAGAAGAVFAGLFSHFVLPASARESVHLVFAAAGALIALGIVHAAWVGRMRRPQTK